MIAWLRNLFHRSERLPPSRALRVADEALEEMRSVVNQERQQVKLVRLDQIRKRRYLRQNIIEPVYLRDQ